jgi:hypothetical protein
VIERGIDSGLNFPFCGKRVAFCPKGSRFRQMIKRKANRAFYSLGQKAKGAFAWIATLLASADFLERVLRRLPGLQHVEHGTGWRRIAGTMGDRLGENLFKFGEVDELRPHIVEMRLRDPAHLGAGAARRLSESQQNANIVDAESELASAANESQPSNVRLFVGAVAAFRPGRFRHQPYALVIAHCLEIDACRAGEPSDRQHPHAVRNFPLAPVAATECRIAQS